MLDGIAQQVNGDAVDTEGRAPPWKESPISVVDITFNPF
jgi:hypothetical protein